MAALSSSQPDGHMAGLESFYAAGGRALHLHGEGGETHSRLATGSWHSARGCRREMLLCSQICHEGWDEGTQRPIDRFTPAAVHEDVSADLALFQTECLDLVYLDDRPCLPMEPVLDALASEAKAGRLKSIGLRNWLSDRMSAAIAYLDGVGGAPVSALITAELALPIASGPLWDGYTPFDADPEKIVIQHGLTVYAHAADWTLGHCLFDDWNASLREALLREPMRRHWVERWPAEANRDVVACARRLAAQSGVSVSELGIAWLLNLPFRVVPIVPMDSFTDSVASASLARASHLRLSDADLAALGSARDSAAASLEQSGTLNSKSQRSVS